LHVKVKFEFDIMIRLLRYGMPPQTSRRPPAARPRPPRTDGAETKLRILRVAGELCAESGFAGMTSKEICRRAEVNAAAVNYHFGSRDELYDAVLVEAHRQLISVEDLGRIVSMPADVPQRLQALLRALVARAGEPPTWGARVLVRELMSPSGRSTGLLRDAVLPKSRLLLGLVGEVLGRPVDALEVQAAAICFLAPCLMMLVAPRDVRRAVFPATASAPEALADAMSAYAANGLAGLRAAGAPPARAATRPASKRPARR
jgi:AcrR family transcriptional regulator